MKGTIAIETIAVVAVLLALFIIIELFVINNIETTSVLSGQFAAQGKCNRLANIITSIYNAGSGTQWVGSIDRNVSVYSDYIDLWGGGAETSAYCAFYADLNSFDFNIASGEVIVENAYGRVVIKNA